MGFVTTLIATAAVASATMATLGATGVVGGKKESKPAAGPSGSAKADLAAAEKAAAERAALANDKRKAALARSRTIYTSPLGISEKAQVAKKTLTGQ